MTEVLYIEVFFIATGIDLIWSNRLKSAGTSEATMRAELEARAGLFRANQGKEAARGRGHYGQLLAITM